MSRVEEFAEDCRAASQQMRRLPADLRRALGTEVKPRVAEPLAAKIRVAYRGPWAEALTAGTKTRVSGDPQIVVGGSRSIVRGGATARDLVYGTEWGGGSRVTIVNRERKGPKNHKRRGRVTRDEVARQYAKGKVIYRRRTTQQFDPARPAVFPTIRREMPWVLDQFGDIVDEVFAKGLTNG